MNQHLSRLLLVLFFVSCVYGTACSAVYDDVYWIGGDGEWTGDVTAIPEYATGHWSTDPDATEGLPAKFVLGRNDGIRVGQAIGQGGYDLDRLPCDSADECTADPPVVISGGTQLGTDIYINTGATVTYNPNRQLLSGDDAPDRFGDFRFQPDSNFPGTPTLNLSNGSVFDHITTVGGDSDGMWTRWNGAALNIDNAIFRRSGDEANGFSGGAFMLASYHGYENSVQTVSLTNGGRIENEGQLWFGVSGNDVGGDNEAGISIIMTINDGHLDLTGGDEYELDNDGLPLRADLAFIYDWTYNDDEMDPSTFDDNETYIINFTGPGTITVDGDSANPLDGDMTNGGGGIRIAMATESMTTPGKNDYGTGGQDQRSYQDLWDMGILRANNQSGLTGANFNDFFTVTNNPGDNDYMLTSLVEAALNGDFDDSGQVAQGDLDLVLLNWGKTVPPDAVPDGWVNDQPVGLIGQGYLDKVLLNWGNTAASGAAATVPEPASLALWVVAALCAGGLSHPRRRRVCSGRVTSSC